MYLLTWSSAIGLWLVLSCGITLAFFPSCSASTSNYDFSCLTANPLATCLVIFNNLNVFIAICEICLGYHIRFIQSDYQKKLKIYGNGNQWQGAFDLLCMPITLRDAFDGKNWALMWSTYSLFDPSYQNNESFGFFIDVGNGWTTIPTCLFLNHAILFPERVDPLILGCVVLASNWQMLYGTIIYFLSFIFNKRYEGHAGWSIFLFVGTTNGVWFIFPGMAIYAAYVILRDGNLNVLSICGDET